MKEYFWTEDRCIGRLDKGKGMYTNAEVLRDGKWVVTAPAELLWNANPITKAKAIVNLTKWVYDPVTEEEAMRLLSEET